MALPAAWPLPAAWLLNSTCPPPPAPQFLDDTGVTGADECFRNLLKIAGDAFADDAAAAQRARQQHASYKAKEGLFGQPEAAADASAMPAWQWWHMYGSSAP
jgi:hypothetical protein